MQNLITNEEKLVIIVCGLPARGKSFIARKIAKFLIWSGFETKVFSIGQFRRELIDKKFDIRFFNNDNQKALKLREDCIIRVVDDMFTYLLNKGKIAIIDGTNTRISRRRMIEDLINKKISELKKQQKFDFIWVESKINSKEILANSFKSKLLSEDYKNWNKEEALCDYLKRIEIFENIYEPISEENDPNRSFIVIEDQGLEIITKNLQGYLPSKFLAYLTNLQFGEFPIFLTRHGQSEFNELEKIGGDSGLSKRGFNYANKLKEFLMDYLEIENEKKENGQSEEFKIKRKYSAKGKNYLII
jgi:adenylylsulfate kinase-like enzyme